MDMKTSEIHKPYIKLKTESGSENIHYSVLYEELPEEFRLLAERELDETEEKRMVCLYMLKESMKRQNILVDDELLLAFLRNQKFNVKKAEAKLNKFLPKWREIVKRLAALDMRKIEAIIDDAGVGVLPYRDKHGRIVIYTRPYGVNLEQYTVHDILVMQCVMGFMFLKYPLTTVTGFVSFRECKTHSLYIFYSYLKAAKEIMGALNNSPARIARIEILNPNHVARCVSKILIALLSRKIAERFCFHAEGYADLQKLYDPNMLPEEFGGNMGPLNSAVYRQKLLDFIKELRNK